MQLPYCGVSHAYSPNTAETVETEVIARFLGQAYKLRRPVYQPYQEKLNLVYRGVAYSTGNLPTTLPPLVTS